MIETSVTACSVNSDCDEGSVCIDMNAILIKFLGINKALRHYDVIRNKLALNRDGRECTKDPEDLFTSVKAEDILKELNASKDRLLRIFKFLEDHHIIMATPPALYTGSDDVIVNHKLPSVRQGTIGMDNSALMMMLAMKGKKSTKTEDVLPLLLLTSSGTSGVGGSLMSNPFLFNLLLAEDKTSSSSDLDKNLLLMMTTILSGNLAAGGKSSDLMTSPLLLFSMLKDQNTDLKDILPLMMMGGGLGSGNNQMMSNPFIYSMLLKDTKNSSSSIEKLLPSLLLTSIGGAGSDIQGLLPMLLLMKDDEIDEKTLMIMMMGGGANQDLASLLPLLLLKDDEMDLKDLFLFSLFSQQAPSDDFMELVANSYATQRSGETSKSLSKLLPIMIMQGNNQMQNMIPLLVMNEKLNQKDILLMILLNSPQSSKSLLPLLLTLDDDSSFMNSSMLSMLMMMAQLQPSSIVTNNNNGFNVAPNSMINILLPFMMIDSKGESSNKITDMLVLAMIQSQHAPQLLG